MRLIIGLLAVAVPAIAMSQTVVSKTPYGVAPSTHESKYIVSPDGQHVAVVKSSGSRRLVSIDGVDGEIFDSIEIIGQNNKTGVKFQISNEVIFSANGKRYAYGARRGGDNFVVVDGKTYPGGRNFIFSPDSSRFAYMAVDDSQAQQFSVVVDGVQSPRYHQVQNLMFSDDGSRFIYNARLNSDHILVVDGKATPVPGGISHLKMSANGKRYGYITSVGDSYVAVIDGVQQKSTARQRSMGDGTDLVLSADGKRWAVSTIVTDAKTHTVRMIIDGKPGPGYLRVDEFQFSPDSKRYAYVASVGTSARDARSFLVVDGKKTGLEYREVRQLQFSPDSRRYKAFASTDAGGFVIVDGAESEAFIQQVEDFRFTNSGRYTFIGRQKNGGNGNPRIFIDGKPLEGVGEPEKNTMTFSPDGNRIVFGFRSPQPATWLDGSVSDISIMQSAGMFAKESAVFSPDSKHVTYMSNKDAPKVNIYVNGNPGVLGLNYTLPTFSADGKHFAVAGRVSKANAKWTVFVDGKAVTEVDDVLSDDPGTFQFAADGKLYVIAKSDKQFVRYTIDPQGSTLDSFTANMSKSGKTGDSKSAKNVKSPTLPGQTTVANNDPQNAAEQQMSELEKKQAEMQKKLEEMQQEAKKSTDKKAKKVKEIIDIFK